LTNQNLPRDSYGVRLFYIANDSVSQNYVVSQSVLITLINITKPKLTPNAKNTVSLITGSLIIIDVQIFQKKSEKTDLG